MTDRLTVYDPAEDLTSDAAIAIFLAEAFDSEDAAYIAHALGVVAPSHSPHAVIFRMMLKLA